MERFSSKTVIISGAGAVGALAELGPRRLFLVTDPYFMKNGMARQVVEASKAGESEIFDGVEPDPTVDLAARGTARLRAFGADMVVALGGGSAMDCAKAMTFFAKGAMRLVAIPTTSGSGSEVTNFAILTHDKIKHPLVDDRIQPDYAILDSDLLQELPKSLIADAGFDVLSHAAEAFRSAYAALPASFAGRKEVRLKVHLAAAMAGVAFTQAGLGLCHAISHSLGGMFHVPHGRLNAILLPAVIGCNAHAATRQYAELARAAGMGGSADTIALRNLRSGLVRLRQELELPQTLSQAGIPPRAVWSQVGTIVAGALGDPCCDSNPVKPDDFLVRRILEEVTGRG